MTPLYIKSLHIIFVVSWFAGLFYNVRLFIYWTEAQDKEEAAKIAVSKQLEMMSKKLWHIITWPASIIALLTGSFLVYTSWSHFPSWLILKLSLVLGLFIYQIHAFSIHKQMSQKIFKMTSTQLRLYNEIATLFLFAVVFLVVLKNALNMVFGVVGLFALAILLMLGVRLYKKLRNS